jgi:hypothetical protein
MPIARSVFSFQRRPSFGAAPQPPSGLSWAANDAPGSDARIVFSGANLLPRLTQTVLWRELYTAQLGYQATTWNSPNNGVWDSGVYSVGMHGHPCDGTFNAAGQRLVGTGSGGTVQWEEIAGLGAALDCIASPSSPGPQSSFLLTAGVWRRKARVISPSGGNTVHTYYPDLVNRPSEFIRQTLTTASIGSGGANPAFYFGSSDWQSGTAGVGTNNESPGAVLRGLQLYTPALTNTAHIQALAAFETDAQVLAYCAANGLTAQLHYLNTNPTPSDITDKSGAGHHPSWANAARPALWS